MKKKTFISLLIAAVIFSGCGHKTQNQVIPQAQKQNMETAKEATRISETYTQEADPVAIDVLEKSERQLTDLAKLSEVQKELSDEYIKGVKEQLRAEVLEDEIIFVELNDTEPYPYDLDDKANDNQAGEQSEKALHEEETENAVDTKEVAYVDLSETEAVDIEDIEEYVEDNIPIEPVTVNYTQIVGDYAAMYDSYVSSYIGDISVIYSGDFSGMTLDQIQYLDNLYKQYYNFGQPADWGLQSVRIMDTGEIVDVIFIPQDKDTQDYYVNKIADKFGVYVYETEEETIARTWERVHSIMAFNEGYLMADMGQCLDGERGVCWTYSQIIRTLLNLEGIQTRFIIGYQDGGGHGWVQVYVNGSWVDLEPTNSGIYPPDISQYEAINL